jgi:Ca2+-binding RTX toxin-like protein
MGYRRVVLVLCLCGLFCPGIGSAGTVELVNETLSYVAAPGESNQLFALAEEDGVRITDTTAPIAVGQGCASIGPGEAFCARSPDSKISFHLLVGDMNDLVRVTAAYFGGRAIIDGGDGDDDLKGGGGLNILDGGAGADTFRGAQAAETSSTTRRVRIRSS